VAKPTKNKKNKEGRHVGLDFYDLLIEEALIDPKPGILSVTADYSSLPLPPNADLS
jgi:hypothetical protein